MEVTREDLERLYVKEGRSARELADLFGVSATTIYRMLDEHGIERRSPGGMGLEAIDGKARGELAARNPDRLCKGVCEDGERCTNWAVRGKHYCRKHLFGDKGIPGRDAFPSPLEWTDCRRVIYGEPFTLERHPYLVEIYKDNSPYIVIQKAAQMGVSEYALNRSLWFCETGRGNVIYTLPTATDCADFSKMRISPIMSENEWESDNDNDRKEIDNVRMKQIGNRFMVLKGSWDSRHAISIPSDMNVHDEVDFSKAGIINQYKARLGHSEFAWQLFLSTPTLPEMRINKLFLETDQRHWYVKCTGCGEEHCLCCGFPDLIIDNEFRCPKCGAVLDRTHGRWIARFPDREKHGYHISRLMATWASAKDILEAKEEYNKIKDFYNLELGLPYAGENVPLDMKILGECEDERVKLHMRDEACTAGVDQGNECFVVISKRARNGKKQVVWVDHIPLDLTYQALEQFIDQFKINTMVIDALPNTASARKLSQKFPGRVFLCYYRENQKEPFKWDFNTHTVTVNRTETLSRMTQRFHDHEVMLPVHEKLSLYKKHLTNLVTVTEENEFTGEKIMKFTHKGDDHYAHANNYDDIAQTREARNRVVIHRLNADPPEKTPRKNPNEGIDAEVGRIPDEVWKEFIMEVNFRGKTSDELQLPFQHVETVRELWNRHGITKLKEAIYRRIGNGPNDRRVPKPAGPAGLEAELAKIPDNVCREFIIQRETQGKMVDELELPGNYKQVFIELVHKYSFNDIFKILYPRCYNQEYLTDRERARLAGHPFWPA